MSTGDVWADRIIVIVLVAVFVLGLMVGLVAAPLLPGVLQG